MQDLIEAWNLTTKYLSPDREYNLFYSTLKICKADVASIKCSCENNETFFSFLTILYARAFSLTYESGVLA